MTLRPYDTEPNAEALEPKIDRRLIFILSSWIRVRFLELLSSHTSLTPVDAVRLLEDESVNLSRFAYHAQVLHEYKLVELAKDPEALGGFAYRLSPRGYITDTVWHQVPSGLRPAGWVAALQAYIQQAVTALEADAVQNRGRFDILPIPLDEEGERTANDAITTARRRIEEATKESVERAAASPDGRANLKQRLIAMSIFDAVSGPGDRST